MGKWLPLAEIEKICQNSVLQKLIFRKKIFVLFWRVNCFKEMDLQKIVFCFQVQMWENDVCWEQNHLSRKGFYILRARSGFC